MIVIPAIDLHEGQCVRLLRGDFDQRTEYSKDPASVARKFRRMGFEKLHIVDLDGARYGRQNNQQIVREIAATTGLAIQLGGGMRDRDAVASWLSAGVSRCVIGSLAVTEPSTVKNWLTDFGAERIVLALDVKTKNRHPPQLVTHGWTRSAETNLWHCLDNYLEHGIQQVLCTDVGRDGTMTGPNLDLYRDFVGRYPTIRLQASGGVRHTGDLRALHGLGAYAAITGRALLDGKISGEELGPYLHVA